MFFGTWLIDSAAAQTVTDSVPLDDSVLMKKHSPRKATIYSTLVPGLGQIYNRKYWKLPIIYAGFGLMGYFIYTNTDSYLIYRSAYIERINGNYDGNYSDLVNKYNEDELLSAADYYRRNLEISILVTALWYILNIIDATVDAHLYTYNITENLSLRVTPDLLPPAQAFRVQPGIKLSLCF
ncbi:MAG: hypothetical protein HQ542_11810 [Bacteroidia bacterium]|nr:hypothetical protein [Bacteroidia bacterium]